MPNCDNQSSSGGCCRPALNGYKEVIIIGNGPSGLCLSYFLSGHWPYWNRAKVSDELLQMRLDYLSTSHLSLIEQDLEYLADGLEGRSTNPVALLYDKLKHPDGDLGIDLPTCLDWKFDPEREVSHICIGKAPGPGGAWNDIDGSALTISPSRWMELPDMSFADWKRHSKLTAGFGDDSSSSLLTSVNKTHKTSQSSPNIAKYFLNQRNAVTTEESRVSMHDVKNYYRDFVKQKNLDKYLLNNATVTSVRRINCPNKLVGGGLTQVWEVTGLIDRRTDARKKVSSLTHKGDLAEFKYFCKHLVLANGATDIHNELNVKGESSRFILRSIRELEDRIKDDLPRLQKDPLLIVGAGLSAADAILLAQKYHIRIAHVIRKPVSDPNLVFNKLPKKIYPEYHRVYEQMQHSRAADVQSAAAELSYVLYDEHQVKCFTSKRTCILSTWTNGTNTKCAAGKSWVRHKQHRLLNECDEECEVVNNEPCCVYPQQSKCAGDVELKISYACILIGYSPDLSFLPKTLVEQLAADTSKSLDTRDNPILIDQFTHETAKFKNLYAMGPLIGDNFVRFGTGGALAISASIWRTKKLDHESHTSAAPQLTDENQNTICCT